MLIGRIGSVLSSSVISITNKLNLIASNILNKKNALIVRRLTCWVVCFGLLLTTVPILRAASAWRSTKPNNRLTQGPPGKNLPNLDSASRLTPGVPKMISQVPISNEYKAKSNRITDIISGLLSPIWTGSFATSIVSNVSSMLEKSNEQKTMNKLATLPSRSKVARAATSTLQSDDNWAMAMLDPKNRTGGGGEDLLSGNYSWGLPLVSLPGRAGMDLKLGLALNSLVWTKSGPNIHFNLNEGFPAAGFQLGFPELKTYFHNPESGTTSRLVTMPSGEVLEFLENSALGDSDHYIYEERSGSNMIIVEEPGFFDPSETVWKLLQPDGTVYKYGVVGNNPKCLEIKDRNGNYINVTYAAFERISTITDTLGRVVNFNYDQNNRLISITQNWSGQTHTWATFAYQNLTLETYFLSLNMVGAQNGQTISVLSKVGLADGSVFSFEYTPYAQVHTVRHYAPNSWTPGSFPSDYTQLSYKTYNLLGSSSGEQIDCPRFTSRIDWGKDWNDGVTTIFDGDRNSWGTVTSPDGVIHKEFFGTTGWQRGLTVKSETWYNRVKKKWTETIWQNGNETASYQIKPRVIETNLYDEKGNRKRTTMDYGDYGVVSDIREYASQNTNEVYRRTHTDYLRGGAYIDNRDRRMTNLVTSETVYDGNNTLFSKTTYEYDKGGEYLVHQGPPIQHQSMEYGTNFNQGRGNVNILRKWDVTDPNKSEKTLISITGYNTSGSKILTKDGFGHQTIFEYSDAFLDSQNGNTYDRSTYAYLTKTTDAAGFFSTVKYKFDFGLSTELKNPKGAANVNTYDVIGRLEKVTNQVNGAYTRYVYAPNQLSIHTYSTINDLTSEFYSVNILDGYGRIRAKASEHPNSIGGRKAQFYKYDHVGRVERQANITEIDSNWDPAGDDAMGYAWSSQQYDWMGRIVTATNQDGTKKIIDYDDCGCAGVNIVTSTDEIGRKRKEYYDSFGRIYKSQILNVDGSTYSTTSNTYNIDDQLLRTLNQEGENGVGLETLMTYDGYGRVATSKKPIETSPTIYTYNLDDTLHTKTDARGVQATYGYNNRKLITSISHNEIADVISSGNTTFDYDEVGNRKWMNDATGRIDYNYDQLSRIISESSQYNGYSYTFTASYEYNLSGQVTKLRYPSSQSVNYNYDEEGKLKSITTDIIYGDWRVPVAPINAFINDIQYRAWGDPKQVNYGNSLIAKYSYNQLTMQKNSYELSRKFKYEYEYYDDGKVKYVKDLLDNKLDRAYKYDQASRLTDAYSGAEARDLSSSWTGPYKEHFEYDGFDNIIFKSGRLWGKNLRNYSATYVNQRKAGWAYDNSGNLINMDDAGRKYDSANMIALDSDHSYTYDADGRRVREGEQYYFNSAVLGGKALTKIDLIHKSFDFYIYSGDQIIANATYMSQYSTDFIDMTLIDVDMNYTESTTGNYLRTWAQSASQDIEYGDQQKEVDPLSLEVGRFDPEDPRHQPSTGGSYPTTGQIGGGNEYWDGGKCSLDGIGIDCSTSERYMASGAAVSAPSDTTRYNSDIGKFEFFKAYADGYQGWMRQDGNYAGYGRFYFWADHYRLGEILEEDPNFPNGRPTGRYDWIPSQRVNLVQGPLFKLNNIITGLGLWKYPKLRIEQDKSAIVKGDNTSWSKLYGEWTTNTGPGVRIFGPDSDMTQGMMTSPDVARYRRAYCAGLSNGQYNFTAGAQFGFRALDGPRRAGLSMPRQFVGSFTITIIREVGANRRLNQPTIFEIRNVTSRTSFFFHAIPEMANTDDGPGGNKRQIYWWREESPCRNPR